PTVIQSNADCVSTLHLAVENTSKCDATVTSVTITGPDADVFAIVGISASDVPTQLSPGEELGDGVLNITFKPTEIVTKRFLQAQVNVTYISDPAANTETTIVIPIAGEAVQTGMRILVTKGGTELPTVQKIQVQGSTRGQKGYTLNNVPLKHVD